MMHNKHHQQYQNLWHHMQSIQLGLIYNAKHFGSLFYYMEKNPK